MAMSANDSLLILLGVLSSVLGVVLYVWTALALSALFRKTGEDAWQGWVPVLNIAVVLRLGGFSAWLVLVGLVPVLGWMLLYALVVVAAHRIGRDFAVGPGMTVLAALLFVVWASILGLGPAVWQRRERVVEPPPWSFSPPMSEPTVEPLAPPTRETRVVSPNHFSPEPVRESPSDALRPEPWAPPSSFAPVDDAPAVDRAASDAPSDAASAPAAPAASPFAPTPEAAAPAMIPAAAPAGDAPPESAPAAAPAPTASVSGGLDAPDAPADAADAGPAVRAGDEAEAEQAAPAVERPRLRREQPWASEIDDVSAISPSPFPSRAASPRPGVVPSLADPEESGAPAPGRRTWDAVPARSRARRHAAEPEEFPELSGEVSAVIGAPAAGAPRTARAAVPAQLRRAEASADDDLDHTVVVSRRRGWLLQLPGGSAVPLTGDVAILGRQPRRDAAHPRAQLVAVDDATRTMSKTHARLELRGESWVIVDLDSTNGTVLTGERGEETEVAPGDARPVAERFLLGDAELRLARAAG
ncbi:FHA domain-containing protein [Microbacterium radiodurans]|uniref:FHA domain-containing protein n=1 Tax=Microbacterium radiodurans TaxID=661398 RepID=A0A5J5IWP5_9MICO|nr:FHA domain-containing protein [Microbacterium radiodurans]KAA9089000.1 FHA domain-containing protein [Microbacterium radiodurans]